MSADDKRPSRTLGGLASRHSMPPDPSTRRLRRELRAVPEGASAITQPLRPASEPGEPMQQPTTEPGAAEITSATTNTASPSAALPRYLQLIRKESRLRQDQADQLSREVRRINQGRQGRHGAVGERITDNTLIRVAVDLLLARAGELNGTTEDALRQSVGL
jgi:uncharacterized protein YkwD